MTDPKTGVRETEWQKLQRMKRPGPMNNPHRQIPYRFFYKDKTDLVFSFYDDHRARRWALDDPFVREVQALATGRIVYRIVDNKIETGL